MGIEAVSAQGAAMLSRMSALAAKGRDAADRAERCDDTGEHYRPPSPCGGKGPRCSMPPPPNPLPQGEGEKYRSPCIRLPPNSLIMSSPSRVSATRETRHVGEMFDAERLHRGPGVAAQHSRCVKPGNMINQIGAQQ